MSSDPVGGYILFPPTLQRTDLITVTLQAMELTPAEFEVRLPDEEGFPRFSGEGWPSPTGEPLAQALAHLAQQESGVIAGTGSRGAEIFWFEPPAQSYPVMMIWVDNWAMMHFRSEKIESFVQRWLHLCEQGQAVYGYFSPFSHMYERDDLEGQILPAVQRGDLSQLLKESGVFWLIYLGSDLAARWRQEQTPLPISPLVSQDLPSGAHFFRTSTTVFG